MKQCARNSITTLAILALAGLANASVVALGNGLATLFTDNIDAGGPSTAVTLFTGWLSACRCVCTEKGMGISSTSTT